MVSNVTPSEPRPDAAATPPDPPAAGSSGPTSNLAKRLIRKVLVGVDEPLTLSELYRAESQKLGDAVEKYEVGVLTGSSGEPWVVSTTRDRFGVALSGGGIRSATFNLGLLQTLARFGVLRNIDYLSTVSGGGYIGGFWTAWLHRHRRRPGDARFPTGQDHRGGERAEVRHLREFSRFLLPRVGILETEFWGVVMTVLGGMLPSLAAALAVLALAWCAWVGLLAALFVESSSLAARAIWLLLVVYFVASEVTWIRRRKSEQSPAGVVGYSFGAGAGVILLIVVWVFARTRGWFGIGGAASVFTEDALAFAPGLAMGTCVVVLLTVRMVVARFFTAAKDVSLLVGIERAITRFLALTSAFLAIACLWVAGRYLQSGFRLAWTAAGTVTSVALFAWARKWLSEPISDTRATRVMGAVRDMLKRATPKVLATIAVLLVFVLVGTLIRIAAAGFADGSETGFWPVLYVSLGVILATAFLFDPARVGLHEFYRSRISRCYLGASNEDGAKGLRGEFSRVQHNRYTSERPGDDVTLGQLGGHDTVRPIHLVCTAANDMSGDRLGTLYRGARSAVLSVHGITLGDATARLDDLKFSAALTASAAAFNSQMGRVSVDLGPAVTFLMSALNLRLGLWVPHPLNRSPARSWLPGRFFFAELFGRSRADRGHLHLSDGNHFENFGLYELVRRHCRYIIVSDCGADSDVAFDDLANVLRRIREDFGVEIELDVSRLRPDKDGLSKQHAVVGTIHYNGADSMDKGTILYFKPTLTGDEPADVLQYHTRNGTFPHQATGDQFFDEPQWESYRRLGEHACRAVLGFLDKTEFKKTNEVDRLFREARALWYPAPDGLNEALLDMSARCNELERDLAAGGPLRLRAEFFVEATELVGPGPAATTFAPTAGLEEELGVLGYLNRAIQIMEDIWIAGDLDRYWSHPLNGGWMNYCHRWAATPSFRRWWPVLAPLCNAGFREFVKSRFALGVTDEGARQGSERAIEGGRLALRRLAAVGDLEGSDAWRQFSHLRHPVAGALHGKVALAYELRLRDYSGELDARSLLIGFALVSEQPAPFTTAEHERSTAFVASWQGDEFFVPPTFVGGGFVARMLDAVVGYYQSPQPPFLESRCARLEVHLGRPGVGAGGRKRQAPFGPGERFQRVNDIQFYKSRGFLHQGREDPSGAISLHLDLDGGV